MNTSRSISIAAALTLSLLSIGGFALNDALAGCAAAIFAGYYLFSGLHKAKTP